MPCPKLACPCHGLACHVKIVRAVSERVMIDPCQCRSVSIRVHVDPCRSVSNPGVTIFAGKKAPAASWIAATGLVKTGCAVPSRVRVMPCQVRSVSAPIRVVPCQAPSVSVRAVPCPVRSLRVSVSVSCRRHPASHFFKTLTSIDLSRSIITPA